MLLFVMISKTVQLIGIPYTQVVKVRNSNASFWTVFFIIIIIIIMVIFKCYFSGELIALSYKKNNNNNGVNIELGKTNRLKALCMMQMKK